MKKLDNYDIKINERQKDNEKIIMIFKIKNIIYNYIIYIVIKVIIN